MNCPQNASHARESTWDAMNAAGLAATQLQSLAMPSVSHTLMFVRGHKILRTAAIVVATHATRAMRTLAVTSISEDGCQALET